MFKATLISHHGTHGVGTGGTALAAIQAADKSKNVRWVHTTAEVLVEKDDQPYFKVSGYDLDGAIKTAKVKNRDINRLAVKV